VNIAGSIPNLLGVISADFFDGNMSSNLYNEASIAASAQTTAKAKAQAALYVALTSGEYQVIH
jgi:hypothetical protein